jgi:hypothetical protein
VLHMPVLCCTISIGAFHWQMCFQHSRKYYYTYTFRFLLKHTWAHSEVFSPSCAPHGSLQSSPILTGILPLIKWAPSFLSPFQLHNYSIQGILFRIVNSVINKCSTKVQFWVTVPVTFILYTILIYRMVYVSPLRPSPFHDVPSYICNTSQVLSSHPAFHPKIQTTDTFPF